jgi:hypothetical protein
MVSVEILMLPNGDRVLETTDIFFVEDEIMVVLPSEKFTGTYASQDTCHPIAMTLPTPESHFSLGARYEPCTSDPSARKSQVPVSGSASVSDMFSVPDMSSP